MMEEDFINIEYKDKETGKVTKTKTIKNDIFRDGTKHMGKFKKFYLKRVEWLINKLMKHADNHLEHRVRYKRIHMIVKNMIVHRGLKICERIIGKHMIKELEDIPDVAWNNHQRIWLDSWNKAHDDMWTKHLYYQFNLNPDESAKKMYLDKFPTEKSYLDYSKKQRSYISRKMLGRLYMTEVLEDSVDRTMSDCFVMRIAHSMMEFYGVKPEERAKVPTPGEYPIYLSNTQQNKQFFISFANIPVWYPRDSKETKINDLLNENYQLKKQLDELKKKDCELCKLPQDIKTYQGNSSKIIEQVKK